MTRMLALPLIVSVMSTAVASGQVASVPWTELEYSAHKFLLSAGVVLRVEDVSPAELKKVLKAPPEGRPVQVGAAGAIAITSETRMPFNRNEDATVWIDDASGAALQLEKLNFGGKDYWKRLRYTTQGFYQWRAEPRSKAEPDRRPELWTGRSETFKRWSPTTPEGAAVTESYALLYLVSRARLDRQGSELVIYTVADDRLVEITFTGDQLIGVRMAFDEVVDGRTNERRGMVVARRVLGTGRFVGDDAPSEDVETGFLGMRGPLEMLIEQGTGVPLEISGNAKGIGSLAVKLKRVVRSPAKVPAIGESRATRGNPGG